MKTNHPGFTLIEILIVVAIIGILAAIAVPNFNNALIKAKVTRVKADMTSIATAIDMYGIDYKGFPVPGDAMGVTINLSSPNTPWTATKLSPTLTTPVPYMSMLPFDLFNEHSKGAARRYNYATKDYADVISDPVEIKGRSVSAFDKFVRKMYWAGRVSYLLHSYGPDCDTDIPEERTTAHYDATNGIYSSGDVLHFSKGSIGAAGGLKMPGGRGRSRSRDGDRNK